MFDKESRISDWYSISLFLLGVKDMFYLHMICIFFYFLADVGFEKRALSDRRLRTISFHFEQINSSEMSVMASQVSLKGKVKRNGI